MTVAAPAPTARPLIERVSAYLPPEKVRLVEDAYAFAAECHRDQKRLTGDPYIVHPLDAAMTVASLQLDAPTVAGALLHDVQEDCGVPNTEIVRRFGEDVGRLVDGATKLDKIKWRADERPGERAIQAENLRKMFLAMAEDIGVVIIKLADRLHKARLSEGDVLQAARASRAILSLERVRYAILETDGTITILPKEEGDVLPAPRRNAPIG